MKRFDAVYKKILQREALEVIVEAESDNDANLKVQFENASTDLNEVVDIIQNNNFPKTITEKEYEILGELDTTCRNFTERFEGFNNSVLDNNDYSDAGFHSGDQYTPPTQRDVLDHNTSSSETGQSISSFIKDQQMSERAEIFERAWDKVYTFETTDSDNYFTTDVNDFNTSDATIQSGTNLYNACMTFINVFHRIETTMQDEGIKELVKKRWRNTNGRPQKAPKRLRTFNSDF